MAKTIINIRTQNEWVCQIICTFAEYKPQKRNEEISHADIARQCKNKIIDILFACLVFFM